MGRIAAFLALVLAALANSAAAAPWEALVTVEEVREGLATPGLRIVDLRGTAAYAGGHADGGVSMPVDRWKAAAEEDRLPEVIGEAGIHPDRPLLLVHYDTGPANFAEAAWIAWELKSRGVRSVSVLEGGMQAWSEAGIRQTERVHDHRTYDFDYPRHEGAVVEGPELQDIRDGIGRVARVSTGALPGQAGDDEFPAVSLTELLGTDDVPVDRAALLDRVKNAPIPWGTGRVVIVGDSIEAAPAFWFLVSEVLGIRDVAVAPLLVSDDLGLARLEL